jgi:imidazole glycerol-phosphate synthase subunit HisH
MSTVIVDYGMGNTGSIRNMLHRIGAPSAVSRAPETLRAAERIILPGVGAFDSAVSRIHELGLWPVLDEIARSGTKPVLGICLGMQLMTAGSDEGLLPGFGWFPGRCARFEPAAGANLKVPHMGWRHVSVTHPTRLTEGFDAETRFYFVHSYYAPAAEDDTVMLTTEYGKSFASGLTRGLLFGVQFHPEKSHLHGMRLLENFVAVRA